MLDALIYAILNGEGMVKVVGEVGSGKTMLCRMLEKELPEKVEVVYLANPSLSPENILHAIAFELKLTVSAETSRLQVMHNLQEYLLERHAENRQVVVFVEEAQAMPIATLEEIRLLSNLETQQSKLLQIVLFGQPELDELIAKPEIRQLKERITYSFQLNPFVSEHIRDYLNSRLRASGYRSGEIFDKAAIRKIEHYSRGLLRRVNILADKSMLAAYAANTHQVGVAHVKQAARDSEFISQKRTWLWGGLAGAGLLLTAVLLIAVFNWDQLVDKQAKVQQGSNSVETRPLDEATPGRIESNSASTHLPLNDQKMELLPAEQVESGEETVKMPATSTETETVPRQVVDSPRSVPESTTITNSSKQEDLELASDLAFDGDGIEDKLLNLNSLFELQDLGDARLSSEEAATLRRQLKELPPEVALYQDSAQFSDICKLCWSILYRPVTEPENL